MKSDFSSPLTRVRSCRTFLFSKPKRKRSFGLNPFCWLSDGRVVSVPLAWFPRLSATTPLQLATCVIGAGGRGLHWDELDEDLSVAELLRAPIGEAHNHALFKENACKYRRD